MRLDQEAENQYGQAHVGAEEMRDRQAMAVQWMSEQPREQLVANTEYKHREKADDVHVRVRRTVDDPLRMNRDRHAEHDTRREPEERGANEGLDEPFHPSKAERQCAVAESCSPARKTPTAPLVASANA